MSALGKVGVLAVCVPPGSGGLELQPLCASVSTSVQWGCRDPLRGRVLGRWQELTL